MSSRSESVRSLPLRRSPRDTETTLRAGHPAVILSVAVAGLVLLGLIMILSASSVESFATYGSSFLFFKKQLIGAAFGIVGFIFFVRLDYHRLSGYGYALMVVVVGLLLAVLVPGVGVVAGGSARWLNFGPMSFQPSELAKLALILFAADVFSRKLESSFDSFAHTVVPIIPALAILAVLILKQPDLGSMLVLGGIGMSLLFVAGAPVRYVAPLLAGAAVLTTVASLAEPYRRARILAFLNPWADPFRTGYHTIQSLIAMGSGGWFGVGLGASRQKWMYIPNAHTDFIFAILGEETGVVGSLFVLGLFAFVTFMGVRTARRAPDRYGTLIASGITAWVALQALINIGAVTAALPITGVPLPLVSYGGTSLLILLCAMGILVNIAYQGEMSPAQRAARYHRRKARPAAARPSEQRRAGTARPRPAARRRGTAARRRTTATKRRKPPPRTRAAPIRRTRRGS
jgi:cell division protein FtsW